MKIWRVTVIIRTLVFWHHISVLLLFLFLHPRAQNASQRWDMGSSWKPGAANVYFSNCEHLILDSIITRLTLSCNKISESAPKLRNASLNHTNLNQGSWTFGYPPPGWGEARRQWHFSGAGEEGASPHRHWTASWSQKPRRSKACWRRSAAAQNHAGECRGSCRPELYQAKGPSWQWSRMNLHLKSVWGF